VELWWNQTDFRPGEPNDPYWKMQINNMTRKRARQEWANRCEEFLSHIDADKRPTKEQEDYFTKEIVWPEKEGDHGSITITIGERATPLVMAMVGYTYGSTGFDVKLEDAAGNVLQQNINDKTYVSLSEFVKQLEQGIELRKWDEWLQYEALVPVCLKDDNKVLLECKEPGPLIAEREKRRGWAACVQPIASLVDYKVGESSTSKLVLTAAPSISWYSVHPILVWMRKFRMAIQQQTTETIVGTWCIGSYELCGGLCVRVDLRLK